MPSKYDNTFVTMMTGYYDVIDECERSEWIENTLCNSQEFAKEAMSYLKIEISSDFPELLLQAIMDAVFWDNVLQDVRDYVAKNPRAGLND